MTKLIVFMTMAFSIGVFATSSKPTPPKGWHYALLKHDAQSEFAIGHAEAALVLQNASPKMLPVAVLVNHVDNVPTFDRQSLKAWREHVIGKDAHGMVLAEDFLIRVGSDLTYVAHYQVARGGPIPEDTLIRASFNGTRVLMLSYTSIGQLYLDNKAKVTELYRQAPLSY